jgi:hypothetical protein
MPLPAQRDTIRIVVDRQPFWARNANKWSLRRPFNREAGGHHIPSHHHMPAALEQQALLGYADAGYHGRLVARHRRSTSSQRRRQSIFNGNSSDGRGNGNYSWETAGKLQHRNDYVGEGNATSIADFPTSTRPVANSNGNLKRVDPTANTATREGTRDD